MNMDNSSRASLLHFSSKPAEITIRKDKGSDEVQQTSLQHLVETRCKSLFTPFKPAWWLPAISSYGGVYPEASPGLVKCGTKGKALVVHTMQLLRLSDGGTLGLDFYPLEYASLAEDVPTIVVSHGLSGGSYEPYIRTILIRACAPVEKGGLGYRAVVVTVRGCNGVPMTSPRFFSGGHTGDLRQALMYIAHRYPRSTLLGLGFSAGANVMTRYLADEGEKSRISAACMISCPWDLATNSDNLQASWFRSFVYGRAMGRNMRALIQIHHKALSLDPPDQPLPQAVARTLALKHPTLTDYDSAYSRFVGGEGPGFPFPDVNAYYNWASSHDVIKDIKVLFLTINAADDPIVQHVPVDGGDNPFVVTVLTSQGSHLAWYESADEKWTTRPVMEWLQTFGEYVVDNSRKLRSVLYVDEKGYVREEGKDELSCRECDGGGTIEGNVDWLQMFIKTGTLVY